MKLAVRVDRAFVAFVGGCVLLQASVAPSASQTQTGQPQRVISPPAGIITAPLQPDTGRQIQLGTDVPLQGSDSSKKEGSESSKGGSSDSKEKSKKK